MARLVEIRWGEARTEGAAQKFSLRTRCRSPGLPPRQTGSFGARPDRNQLNLRAACMISSTRASTQHCRIHKETAPAKTGAAWPGVAHPRGVRPQRYQHATVPSRPCPAEAGHGAAILAEEQNSRNRIRRPSPLRYTLHTESRHAHTTAPARRPLAICIIWEKGSSSLTPPLRLFSGVCQRVVPCLSLGWAPPLGGCQPGWLVLPPHGIRNSCSGSTKRTSWCVTLVPAAGEGDNTR